MSIIYDILAAAQEPLDVTESIAGAKNDFNVNLDRENIVSSSSKTHPIVLESFSILSFETRMPVEVAARQAG